jgi:hypothetical protein
MGCVIMAISGICLCKSLANDFFYMLVKRTINELPNKKVRLPSCGGL